MDGFDELSNVELRKHLKTSGNYAVQRIDSLMIDPSDDPLMDGFEGPELEFDDDALDLELNNAMQDDDEQFIHDIQNGRITPDGMIDEDFEDELGCAAQEMNVQEIIDREYKEISRLGIVQLAGDDKFGRKVIVFSACRLPPNAELDHQRFLEYIKKTLQQYVANDYVLVYFHFGYTSKNKPSNSWILKAYGEFGRDFRKNLKALYIVHPTRFAKFMLILFKPFISHKFGRKIVYINYLDELRDHVHLEQLPIPDRVISHDNDIQIPYNNESQGKSGTSGLVPYSQFNDNRISAIPPTPTFQFGVSLDHIKFCNNGDPVAPIVRESMDYLRKYALTEEGIFRKAANNQDLRLVVNRANEGQPGDFADFNSVHLPAMIFKKWIRDLPEPILTYDRYDDVLSVQHQPVKLRVSFVREIITGLSEDNYAVLDCYINFLTEIESNSAINLMNAKNLGITFAENFIRPRHQMSLPMLIPITNFTELMINYYEDIFIRDID